jgi:cytochrome c
MGWLRAALAITSLALMVEAAFAAGDAAEGQKVFQICITCHSVAEKTNKTGPYLQGVVGRPVATAEGYAYSEAMKTFGATGAVWDEATLDAFLKDPMGFVRGSKMAFVPPIRRETERADLIAFLKSN